MLFSPHIFSVIPALLLLGVSLQADTNKSSSKSPEQKFQAILVWGTDEDKPVEKEEELKAIEPELKEKVQFLKWKNYFQVGDRKRFSIRVGETKGVQLSHKCKLKVSQSEKEGLEVELIGEGKSLWKKNHSMPLKDVLIIGGNDQNATAWMIVLKPE